MPIRTTARTAAFIPGGGHGTGNSCELNTPTTCVGFPLGMSKTNRSGIYGGRHGRNVDAELHCDQLNFWTCSRVRERRFKGRGSKSHTRNKFFQNIFFFLLRSACHYVDRRHVGALQYHNTTPRKNEGLCYDPSPVEAVSHLEILFIPRMNSLPSMLV